MTEHFCECWLTGSVTACGELARFRIRLADDPSAIAWWVCTYHFNELLDDPDRLDQHDWEEIG